VYRSFFPQFIGNSLEVPSDLPPIAQGDKSVVAAGGPEGPLGIVRRISLEDGELADIWYALGGSAVRHPDHFTKLMDACFQELLDRRAESLKPWLEERFRPFRLADSKEDAAANVTDASPVTPA